MILFFTVDRQIITRQDYESVVQDSQNYLYAQFSFSEEWGGTITAVFRGKDGQTFNVLLDESGKCLVPWEVLTQPWFEVSVFCGNLITANVVKIYTIDSGYAIGEEGREPTPDIYSQIIEKIEEIEQRELSPEEVTEIISTYVEENGLTTETDVEQIVATYVTEHHDELKGDTGPQGPQGEAGPQGVQGETGATGPKGDTGETGAPGPKGDTGATPIISASATVSNTTGTPSVNVTKSGTDEAPSFAFAFSNLKGAKGDTGEQGPTGATGPQGPQGPQGEAGADGSVVTVTQTLSSGTKIGSISVDGTETDLFAPQGGGGASSLSDLSDTSISSPSSGDVLVYKGEKWSNDIIGNVDIIPPVHNSGEYASTFGQGTATVKSDGSVDYESSSTSWNGPFFTINGDSDVTNTITIHVNNLSSEMVFSLYAKNVNGQLVQLGTTSAFHSSKTSYSFILTPEEISEKNLRVPFNIGITRNVPISYNVSMEGKYGEELTVADVKDHVYFPLKGKKVIFLGDSITAFTSVQSWVEKFLDITETKKVVNVASISAVLPDYSDTVYDGNPSPSTQHNNTLGNQVQKIINNAYEAPDLIIIAIGTNSGISATDEQIKATYVDSSNNKVPLTDLDKTTSAGAFRYCNETLHNLYPDAKIVWCSPIQGASRYPYIVSSWDDTLDKLTQNGVVYHIHTNRCGIFFANETSGQNGEYLQDGLHPNEAGAWKIANYNASEIIRLFV